MGWSSCKPLLLTFSYLLQFDSTIALLVLCRSNCLLSFSLPNNFMGYTSYHAYICPRTTKISMNTKEAPSVFAMQ